MESGQPRLFILGGPNGAGKTTVAAPLLRDALGIQEFVNPDLIARGLSVFHPEQADAEARRIMVRRVRDLAAQRASFAFETTLSSHSFALWIPELRQAGYRIFLYYLWLASPELAIARVQERVRQGGQTVQEETLRRRYHKGLRNFFHLFRPLTDGWRFYDNSDLFGPLLLAAGGQGSEQARDPGKWQQIRNGLTHDTGA